MPPPPFFPLGSSPVGRRGLAGLVCLGVLALGLSGCGGGGAAPQALGAGILSPLKSCRVPIGHGTYDRPLLHNSGISCSKAVAISLLVVAGQKGPQEVGGVAGPPWLCRDLAPSAMPLVLRCAQGKRFFTVERVHKP